MKNESKTAIIIGATSGIGREVALRLLESGWKVGVAGRRVERLEALRAQFGAEKVAVAQIDVTQPEAEAALDVLLAETGAPDLFFHASGIGFQNRQLDVETELAMIRTNCEGMVRMVDYFINYVKAAGEAYGPNHKAHIAVISSVAGTAGLGTAPAYSATKKMQSTYLSALAQLARMEHLPIRLTDIRPGFVATELLNPDKHYPMMISQEKAARCILRGLRHKKRILIFDWKFRLLVALWRLIPRPLWERITWASN